MTAKPQRGVTTILDFPNPTHYEVHSHTFEDESTPSTQKQIPNPSATTFEDESGDPGTDLAHILSTYDLSDDEVEIPQHNSCPARFTHDCSRRTKLRKVRVPPRHLLARKLSLISLTYARN